MLVFNFLFANNQLLITKSEVFQSLHRVIFILCYKVLLDFLALRCVIDKSTITSLLGKMEKQGFIKRTNNPTDKRAVYIWLTDTGKMLGEKSN